MTEAMEECKIAEESLVNGHSVRLADYYDSITTTGIDFPKTPENDMIITSLYEAMLKTNEIGMQNQQKLLVKKKENFKRTSNTKSNKGGASSETICFYSKKRTLEKKLLEILADKKNTSSGNGNGIAAQAVDVMSLSLPSGFILELNNCYFVPKLCNNIISGSFLINDGYSYMSQNNGCSIFYKNMFYGFAPMVGGYSYWILNMKKISITLMLNVLRRLITPLTYGTIILVTSERNACKNFIKMEY
jgi:hypothetical protein